MIDLLLAARFDFVPCRTLLRRRRQLNAQMLSRRYLLSCAEGKYYVLICVRRYSLWIPKSRPFGLVACIRLVLIDFHTGKKFSVENPQTIFKPVNVCPNTLSVCNHCNLYEGESLNHKFLFFWSTQKEKRPFLRERSRSIDAIVVVLAFPSSARFAPLSSAARASVPSLFDEDTGMFRGS